MSVAIIRLLFRLFVRSIRRYLPAYEYCCDGSPVNTLTAMLVKGTDKTIEDLDKIRKSKLKLIIDTEVKPLSEQIFIFPELLNAGSCSFLRGFQSFFWNFAKGCSYNHSLSDRNSRLSLYRKQGTCSKEGWQPGICVFVTLLRRFF